MSDTKNSVVTTPNTLSASSALQTDSNGNPQSATTTSTELGYVSGVTSAIQTQLNAKQSTALTSAHVLVGNASNVATDTAITGDVSITNAGATTVGTVGGSTAANIHTAEGLVNGSQSGSKFLASPSGGGAGAPAFRAIVSGDVPTLNQNTTGSAGSFTGSLSGDVTGTQSSTAIAANAVTNTKMATMANNTVKGNISGSTAAPSDVTAASAATASSVMLRDTNANTKINNIVENFTTTATATTTTTLTNASNAIQQFTGSTTQTVQLPDCTTLATGWQFQIFNRSTGTVTVKDNGSNTIQAMAGGTQAIFTCASAASANGSWDTSYTFTTGALPVASGGTGQTSYTDGQLLIGDTSSGGLDKATLTAGTNITITNGHGSITIAASSSAIPAFSYSGITSDPNTAVVGTFYVASSSSFNITLPDATTAGNIGKPIIVQHGGTSLTQVYTINTTSSQHLHGGNGSIASGGFALYTAGEVLEVISNGTDWDITRHVASTGWTSVGASKFSATSAYVFTLAANHSATIGAVYSDSSNNLFTVTSTIASSSSLTCSGNGTPASSDTLTKVSGTGDSSFSYNSRTVTGAPAWGTTSVNDLSWKRDGNMATIRWNVAQTGAGTTGSGDYIFYLPTNLNIDTNLYTAYLSSVGSTLINVTAAYTARLDANAQFITTNTPSYSLNAPVFMYSPTSFRVSVFYYNAGDAVGVIGSGLSFISNTGAAMAMTLRVPISGWQP